MRTLLIVMVGLGVAGSWFSRPGYAEQMFMGLGDLPGGSFSSEAFSVSADGSTVVGSSISSSSDPMSEAFRWTSGDGMEGLGFLPTTWPYHSRAYGVSADGSTVVGSSHSTSGGQAFIWDATNGMHGLDVVLTDLGIDLSGWTLSAANDISANGRVIVGHGLNPSGATEAWIAVLPEPSTPLLAACALVTLALLRRRQPTV